MPIKTLVLEVSGEPLWFLEIASLIVELADILGRGTLLESLVPGAWMEGLL